MPGIEWGKGIHPRQRELQSKSQAWPRVACSGWEGGLEWEVASLWPCSQHVGMPCSRAEAREKE